jgi:hypothetical protein
MPKGGVRSDLQRTEGKRRGREGKEEAIEGLLTNPRWSGSGKLICKHVLVLNGGKDVWVKKKRGTPPGRRGRQSEEKATDGGRREKAMEMRIVVATVERASELAKGEENLKNKVPRRTILTSCNNFDYSSYTI